MASKTKKDPYAEPPTMSDEFLFGLSPTVAELNVRPEGSYDDDPGIDHDAVEEARGLDDADSDTGK